MKKAVTILTILFVSISCNEVSELDDGKRLVIEGYLYVGQVGQSIDVSELVPLLGSEDSYSVTEAEVIVTDSGGNEYVFTHSEDTDGLYENVEMLVVGNETYSLVVRFEDQRITAQTIVPAKPSDLTISESTIEIVQITDIEDLQERELVNTTLSWSNENHDSYFVQIHRTTYEGLIVDLDISFPGGNNPFEITTEPTTDDTHVIRSIDLDAFGNHRAVLYSLNEEYVNLYNSFGEDSRSFSEPLTNVVDGLGIFTAINSDTIRFEVVKAEVEEDEE